MTDFGDYEPEDSWHPDDSVAEQITNLIRRAELLEGRSLRLGGEPRDILRALDEIARRAEGRQLTDRERLRVRDLDEDIAFIRGRL